jgi:hypothetical protein
MPSIKRTEDHNNDCTNAATSTVHEFAHQGWEKEQRRVLHTYMYTHCFQEYSNHSFSAKKKKLYSIILNSALQSHISDDLANEQSQHPVRPPRVAYRQVKLSSKKGSVNLASGASAVATPYLRSSPSSDPAFGCCILVRNLTLPSI